MDATPTNDAFSQHLADPIRFRENDVSDRGDRYVFGLRRL
jgi:hypothetical protein